MFHALLPGSKLGTADAVQEIAMGEAARKFDTTVRHASATQARRITLLELVAAIADSAESDAEVVAVVSHLVNTKQVELIGNFCGADVKITSA